MTSNSLATSENDQESERTAPLNSTGDHLSVAGASRQARLGLKQRRSALQQLYELIKELNPSFHDSLAQEENKRQLGQQFMRQVTLNRVKQEHEKQKMERQQTMNLLMRKNGTGGQGQQHKEALKQLFDKIGALGDEEKSAQKAGMPHSHSQKSLPSHGLLATQQSSEEPTASAEVRRDGPGQHFEKGPSLQRGQTYMSKNSEKVYWQIESAFRALAKETELQVGSVFKAQDKFRAEIDTNEHSWMRRLGVHKLNELAKELFRQEIQSERFDEVNLKQFDFTSLASKYNKERRGSARRTSKQIIGGIANQ